jgi:iron complex transport system ATP-binding protein
VVKATDPPVLVVKDLAYGYGAKMVLEDFSLDFYPGKLYFLAGPNGAGKSTLLALLARLKTPVKGQVTLKGKPLKDWSSPELATVLSLAPQKTIFALPFTVAEIVAMGRRPYLNRWGRLSQVDHQKVAYALAKTRLEKLAKRPVTSLSGGEAQRTVLARTLAQDTEVILLDEPTASLDIAHNLELMTLLTELAAEGRTIIVVSHDLALAAVYASDLVLIKDGSLVASGPLEATLTSQILGQVFEAEAEVRPDDFADGLAVSFRPKRGG